MDDYFYRDKEYRKKQSAITKANWEKGVFDFIYKRDKRVCAREGCDKKFEVIHSDPKIYCPVPRKLDTQYVLVVS